MKIPSPTMADNRQPWPRSVKPVVVITVGYARQSEPAPLPASRRKPLEELVRWL